MREALEAVNHSCAPLTIQFAPNLTATTISVLEPLRVITCDGLTIDGRRPDDTPGITLDSDHITTIGVDVMTIQASRSIKLSLLSAEC